MILIIFVEEQIIAVFIEETLVAVHSRAINTEDRLGHERGGQPLLGGNRFDSVLQRQYIIRRLDGIRKAEVDLMLAQSHFVMSHLHVESLRAHRPSRSEAYPHSSLCQSHR